MIVIWLPIHFNTLNMAFINPHINFNGNAEVAFNFYKAIFGGEFVKVVRFKDMVAMGHTFDAAEANKIMHIALPIGGNILMGNDVPAILGVVDEKENRSKIAVSAKDLVEAESIFKGLSEGGEVEMPLAASPWGSYFGMLRDQFGIEWMVDYDPNYRAEIN